MQRRKRSAVVTEPQNELTASEQSQESPKKRRKLHENGNGMDVDEPDSASKPQRSEFFVYSFQDARKALARRPVLDALTSSSSSSSSSPPRNRGKKRSRSSSSNSGDSDDANGVVPEESKSAPTRLRRALETHRGRLRSERGARYSFYGRVRHAQGYNPPVPSRFARPTFPALDTSLSSNAPYVYVPEPAPNYVPATSRLAPSSLASLNLMHNDELYNPVELTRALHGVRSQAIGSAYLKIEDFHRRKKETAMYYTKRAEYEVQRKRFEHYEQQQQVRLQRLQELKAAQARGVPPPPSSVDTGIPLEYIAVPIHPGQEPPPFPQLTAWQRYRHRQLELCQKRTTNGGVIFSGGNALDRRVVVTGEDRQRQLQAREAAEKSKSSSSKNSSAFPNTPSAGKLKRSSSSKGGGKGKSGAAAKAAQQSALEKARSQEHVTSSIRSLLDDEVVNTVQDERMEVSLVLYLYQSGYSINSETHNFRTYSRDSEEFLRSIDLGFIPAFSCDFRLQAKCKYYHGCIIADIYDYRKLNVNMNSPVVTRTLLRPHNETVAGDIERILTGSSSPSTEQGRDSVKTKPASPPATPSPSSAKTKPGSKKRGKKQTSSGATNQPETERTDDEVRLARIQECFEKLTEKQRCDAKLEVERQVLLATQPRLHLDPSPKVHQLLNMIKFSGSIQPSSFLSGERQSMSGRTAKRRADEAAHLAEAAKQREWDEQERVRREALKAEKLRRMSRNDDSTSTSGLPNSSSSSSSSSSSFVVDADDDAFKTDEEESDKRPPLQLGQFAVLPTTSKDAVSQAAVSDTAPAEYDEGFLSIASFMANSREDIARAMHHRLLHDSLFRRTIFNPRPLQSNSSSYDSASLLKKNPTPRQIPPTTLSEAEQRVARANLGQLGACTAPGAPRVTINTQFQTYPPRTHRIPVDSVASGNYTWYQFETTSNPTNPLTHDLIVYARPTHKAVNGSEPIPAEHGGQFDAHMRITSSDDPKPSYAVVPVGNTQAKRTFVREYRRISLREGRRQVLSGDPAAAPAATTAATNGSYSASFSSTPATATTTPVVAAGSGAM